MTGTWLPAISITKAPLDVIQIGSHSIRHATLLLLFSFLKSLSSYDLFDFFKSISGFIYFCVLELILGFKIMGSLIFLKKLSIPVDF
jgi:hypothetical protein